MYPSSPALAKLPTRFGDGKETRRVNNRAWFVVHHSGRQAGLPLRGFYKFRGRTAGTRFFGKEALFAMATYRDPVRVFAPLEMIERLLEIRAELGYSPAIFLRSADDMAEYLDAYGFDVYAFTNADAVFQYGKYRAPLAPGGDHAHCSMTAH
jgi:hypothetical protein